MAEWISVKDRLPEERETVFAKFKGTEKWTPAMFERMSDECVLCMSLKMGAGRCITVLLLTVNGMQKRKIG